MQPTPRDETWSLCLEDLGKIIEGQLRVRRGGIVRRGPIRELWCECMVIGNGRSWTRSPPTAEGTWRAWSIVPRGVGDYQHDEERRSLKLALAQLVEDLAVMTGLGFRVFAERVLRNNTGTQEVAGSCEVSS